MNPKIQKFRDELQKNTDKIERLKARNKELAKKITELQNTDILGMIQQLNMTPEQLAELLSERAGTPAGKEVDANAEKEN